MAEPLEVRTLLAYAPPAAWGSFVGGSGSEFGRAVTLDGGSSIVVGETTSSDAAATNNFGGATFDAFVAKLDANGQPVWFTYLGGGGDDHAFDVAIDGSDNLYVTGYTSSSNLPAAKNTFRGGTFDNFVAKIGPAGQILWTRYVGGTSDEFSFSGIDVDNAGNSVAVGVTLSNDLTAANNSPHGGSDAFAVKLDSNGNQLWATYLGGADSDAATSVALDASGNALLTGQTFSGDFQGALSPKSPGSGSDAFVAKVNSAGATQWARYVGGDGYDAGTAVAVDGSGNAIFAGMSQSASFAGAINTNRGGTGDAIVGVVNGNGAMSWSRFVGGSGQDAAAAIAVDGSGNARIVGQTNSSDLEGVINEADPGNAFLATITSTGQIQSARFLGNATSNVATDVAIDPAGNSIVAGQSGGELAGAINRPAGQSEAYVTKIPSTAATGSIGGKVFNDPNSNGVQDAGESPLADWQIYLDYNNNSVLDVDELSTQIGTDAQGNYSYTGLADGTHYHVKQVPGSGYRKTLPGPGVAGYDVTIAGGAAVTNRNFGATTNILLAGTVFNDTDGDGVIDAGESPVANVTVNIVSNGTIVATRTTDAAGKWQVRGLAAGTGSAEIVVPAGMTATLPVGGKISGSMTSGQQNANLNFGLKPVAAPPPVAMRMKIIVASTTNDTDDDVLRLG